jgi:putative tryptophan/tyrosine transport system substrate-binding protein
MVIDIARRKFIAALGGTTLAWPLAARAQPSKIYYLGSISTGAPLGEASPFGRTLIDDLAKLGYTLGQNLTYDPLGSSGDNAKVPSLVQQLKTQNVQVFIGIGYPVAVAAKALGMDCVVAWGVGDPVATGLIDGLARPGGNITGISDNATTLSSKRLSLLKQMLPTLRRVAILWNKDDLAMSLRYEESARVAQSLDVTVQALGVREPSDFAEAFAAMNSEPPDAIMMVADSLTSLNRKLVFDFASERRLPAIYEYDFFVRTGGLMSYGPDLTESLGRTAALVDRIFKGARPADLPFEEPTHYPFVINLKTAKTIGLAVPPTLLALADEVIE